MKSYLTAEKREKIKAAHYENFLNNPRAKRRSPKKKPHPEKPNENMLTLDGNIGFLNPQRLKPKPRPYLPQTYSPKPCGPNQYQQLIKDYMISNPRPLPHPPRPASCRNFPVLPQNPTPNSKNGSNKLQEVSQLGSGSHISSPQPTTPNQRPCLLAKRSFECLGKNLEKGRGLNFIAGADP